VDAGLVDLVDEALDHVGVLGVEVEGLREVLQRLVDLALASVDLAYHHMNRRLFRYLVLQVEQHLERLILLVQSYQHARLLELVQRVVSVEELGLLEPAECLARLAAVVPDHAHVSVEDGGALVYLDSRLEQLRGLFELLLLKTDVSEAPPGVVVPLVGLERPLVALLR